MFDTPVLPRLRELLDEFKNGTIRIPAIQRGYVWSDEQRLRLMDSIWRGIPIGSLLLWRTTSIAEMKFIDRLGPHQLPAAPEGAVRGYLFDGMQRVTTLYAALMPLPQAQERDNEGRRWPIYFDLESRDGDDLRFRLRHDQHPLPPTWLPLSSLFDDELFLDFRTRLVEMNRKDLLDEARRLETRFRDYVVPILPLVSDDPSLVAEAFTRVNSLGARIDEGDMVHALTLSSSFDLNRELDMIREQLSLFGWDGLDRKTLINSLKAIWGLDIYKAGAKGLKQKLESSEEAVVLRTLPRLVEEAATVLRGFGVHGPGSLPYAYQLVTLVRTASKCGGNALLDAQTQLRRWFFWTTYAEHFTGMTSGQLRTEFDRVEELVRGRRPLNWIEQPTIGPIQKLRANSVRSRAAILVMAIAGDRARGGSDAKQKLYGAKGTEALHRLFADQSAYELANRVLAEDSELKKLRAWARAEARKISHLDSRQPSLNWKLPPLNEPDEPPPLDEPDELPQLLPEPPSSVPSAEELRANLLDAPSSGLMGAAVLQIRGQRLQEEERAFALGLDVAWDPARED